MVLDDYEWDQYRDNLACHPQQAVDAFLQASEAGWPAGRLQDHHHQAYDHAPTYLPVCLCVWGGRVRPAGRPQDHACTYRVGAVGGGRAGASTE